MRTRIQSAYRYVFQGTFVPLTVDASGVQLAPFMTKAFRPEATMADFVNAAFLAAIGIGAMLAVLQLARAGFLYMGSDVWHKKEQARHLIQDAVIGLLLLLSVWIVLNQINPQILNLDVLSKVQPLPGGSSSNNSINQKSSPLSDAIQNAFQQAQQQAQQQCGSGMKINGNTGACELDCPPGTLPTNSGCVATRTGK